MWTITYVQNQTKTDARLHIYYMVSPLLSHRMTLSQLIMALSQQISETQAYVPACTNMQSIGLLESVSDGISGRKGFIASEKKKLIVVYYLTLTKLRNSTNLIRKGGGADVTVYVVVYMYLIKHNVQYDFCILVIKNENSQVSFKEKQYFLYWSYGLTCI